jgi:hypothetical protein
MHSPSPVIHGEIDSRYRRCRCGRRLVATSRGMGRGGADPARPTWTARRRRGARHSSRRAVQAPTRRPLPSPPREPRVRVDLSRRRGELGRRRESEKREGLRRRQAWCWGCGFVSVCVFELRRARRRPCGGWAGWPYSNTAVCSVAKCHLSFSKNNFN